MSKKSLFFNKSLLSVRKHRETGDIDPGTRKRVRRGVVITHASLLLLPLAWYLIVSLFSEPRPQTIKVTIVSPSSAPTSPVSTPARALAKPTPRKQRKAQRPKPPRRKPRKGVKRKPAWKPRKANQIKVSRKVIDNSSSPRYTPPTPVHTVSAAEIEKRLRAAATRSVRSTTTQTSTSAPGGQVSPNYQNKLYSAIYALWREPSKGELNGRYPTVDISFSVDSSGKVSNLRISRKSGVPAMDASVTRLLCDLRTLPRPPKGRMNFTVSLEIVDH